MLSALGCDLSTLVTQLCTETPAGLDQQIHSHSSGFTASERNEEGLVFGPMHKWVLGTLCSSCWVCSTCVRIAQRCC